ncbi:hypothetical protein THAOC_03999, partial [Thalassiosira oceanica]
MAAVVIYGLTAVALHCLDVSAFAPPIVSSATCHASHRSLPSLSRRLVRGDAATLGTASSARLLPSFLSSSGRCYGRRGESPLALRSMKPGRSGGRGRGRGGTRGLGRGRGRGTIRRSGPDFRTCRDVVELADMAHCNLGSMSKRDIAAFWSLLPRLLRNRGAQDPNLEEKLRSILDSTCDRMHSFQYRDLAQTSLGIAKTISQVSRGKLQYRADNHRQIMRRLLLSESQYLLIFDSIASSTVDMLNEFDARHMSNLIYSFGLVERNPDIGGETLFNVFGKAAVKILHTFNSQDISNMLLAFVYVDAKNSALFQKTGEELLGLDLGEFTEQALANILCLYDFWPQALSNVVWAYATAGESHPELFKKMGDHIALLERLDSFDPQALSNTAWAFATAGVPHP